MKFLLIAGFAESLINFRGALTAALQARGLEVHVAAPGLRVGEPLRAVLEGLGLHPHDIPMQRTGTNPLKDFRTLWALRALMHRIRPDYVLGYTIKPAIYGTFAAWLTGVPRRFVLITGLGYAFQGERKRGLLRLLVQWLYGQALSKAQLVFFQNPDDRALFISRRMLGRSAASVVVNGSGVDVVNFSVEPLPQREMPCFLLIARLLGDKGIREYAQAARKIRATHPAARCVLVGWLDENPDSIRRTELEEWIVSNTLDYLGKLSDVRPAIADCSVYVLPSYREGTPRTVLEAMAMGRPIITTDAPGCRETVVNNDNGFLVPVKSAVALEEAMRQFIEKPSLAARMGARSRAIAEEKYDVHKVNALMLREMGIP